MTDLKTVSIQIRVLAIIEKDVAVVSLEDALAIGRGLKWEDVFPGKEIKIADGSYEVVGVFADWNLDV